MAIHRSMLHLTLIILALTIASIRASGTETLIGVVGRDFVMLGADQSVARSIVLTSTEVDKIKVVSDNIVVAAAGELADVDDLMASLKGQVVINELEAGVPSDVEFIDLEASSSQDTTSSTSTLLPQPWTVLSVSAIAKFARYQIAQRLRSQAPYKLGLLVAGMQQEQQPIKRLWKSGIASPSSLMADEVRRQLKVASTSLSVDTDNDDSPEDCNNKLRPYLYWLDEYGSLQKIQYGIHGMGANFGLAVLDQGFRENLSKKEAAELIQNCFKQLQTRFVINSPKPPLIKCVDKDGCHVYDGSD